MIKAGKLDRQITITREAETVAASGAVSKVWNTVATVRAEKVEQTAEEYVAGFGDADGGEAIFRIRYLAGLKLADRVKFEGADFDIDEIAELGRKRGLELRCSQISS